MSESNLQDTILFVDDEKLMLNTIRRSLINEPYEMFFAESGSEALELLEQHEISVLVTDMRMPEMSGLELLTIVQEKYPDTTRIILTAYSQISTLISAINTGQVYRYLTKPWKFETDFLPAIRQAIEYNHLVRERQSMLKQLKAKNLELNKRNFKIQTLLNQVKRSSKQKDDVLSHIAKEVIPFLLNVIEMSSSIVDGAGMKSIYQFKSDMSMLNTNGNAILELVRKVQQDLQSQDTD